MDSEELLAQLADIHLPEPVSFWPPAPGWWVLALLVLIGLVYLGRRVLAARTRRKICDYALNELEGCYQSLVNSPQDDLDNLKLRYVNEVNSVLRRVALVHFPQANVASLGGHAWVDFIRQNGDASLLNEEIAAALSHGRFQTKCSVDADALHSMGRAWISSLYLQSQPVASGGSGQHPDSDQNSEQKDQPIHA